MNKTSLAAIGLAIALSSTAFAGPVLPAPSSPPPSDAGFYLGTDSGVFLLQDRTLDLGWLPIAADLRYNAGWGIDVPLGYKFGNGWSVGISAGYYEAGLSSVSVNSFGFGGHGSEQLVPLLAEVSYNLRLVGPLSWNIGAGIGTAYTKDTIYGWWEEEWDFAFEATTGLSYRVCPNATLDLGYRYFNVNQIEGSRINGHAIELGFRVNF